MECLRLDELDVACVPKVARDVAARVRVHIARVVGARARLVSRSARLVQEAVLARRPVCCARVPIQGRVKQ